MLWNLQLLSLIHILILPQPQCNAGRLQPLGNSSQRFPALAVTRADLHAVRQQKINQGQIGNAQPDDAARAFETLFDPIPNGQNGYRILSEKIDSPLLYSIFAELAIEI